MLRQFLKWVLDILDPPEPESPPSPPEMVPVAKADAVAELAQPTDNQTLYRLHIALIDLLQKDLIRGVRDDEGCLRFTTTPAGDQKVQEILGELRDRGEGD